MGVGAGVGVTVGVGVGLTVPVEIAGRLGLVTRGHPHVASSAAKKRRSAALTNRCHRHFTATHCLE